MTIRRPEGTTLRRPIRVTEALQPRIPLIPDTAALQSNEGTPADHPQTGSKSCFCHLEEIGHKSLIPFRYSHNSTRKLVRDARSAQGSSRGSRGYRSQPSPSSTEETAEETTETDSQIEQQQQHHHHRGAHEYPQFQQPYM